MATLVPCVVDKGGTGNYLSLNAAETANFGAPSANLVADDRTVEVSWICTNGEADTTAVAISGQNTDSTRNITITVPVNYRHKGVWQDSGNIARLAPDSGTALRIGTPYTSIVGVASRPISTSVTLRPIYIYESGVDLGTILVDKCLAFAGATGNGCRLFQTDGITGGTILFRNCIGCGTSATGEYGIIASATASYTVRAYNCTIAKTAFGFMNVGGTVVLKNCLSVGNADDYNGTFDASSVNNGYSEAAGTGGTYINCGTDLNAIFANYSDNYLDLKEGSPAIVAGIDLRADGDLPVTTDIREVIRNVVPCLGAYEYNAPPLLPWPSHRVVPYRGNPLPAPSHRSRIIKSGAWRLGR